MHERMEEEGRDDEMRGTKNQKKGHNDGRRDGKKETMKKVAPVCFSSAVLYMSVCVCVCVLDFLSVYPSVRLHVSVPVFACLRQCDCVSVGRCLFLCMYDFLPASACLSVCLLVLYLCACRM